MKKEITFVVCASLFLLAYILDYFAGSLSLNITSPLYFVTEYYFRLYPMTFVAVAIRSVALMMSLTLILSLIERQYFKKVIIALVIGFVAEIYAFQILATGSLITPVLWTLAISYSGALLLIPTIIYIFLGIADLLIPPTKSNSTLYKEVTPTKQENSSVLNP